MKTLMKNSNAKLGMGSAGRRRIWLLSFLGAAMQLLMATTVLAEAGASPGVQTMTPEAPSSKMPKGFFREGGLTWSPNHSYTYSSLVTTWSGANSFCNNNLKVNNQAGWRLPTIFELTDLYPTMTPLSPPPDWAMYYVWSSTVDNHQFHYGLNLSNGGIATEGPTQNTALVTCVSDHFNDLSNFPNLAHNLGDTDFSLVPPTSPSSGAFSYTSSDPKVVTISGNTAHITGMGIATITATQAAYGSYTGLSITATLTVSGQLPNGFIYQSGLDWSPNSTTFPKKFADWETANAYCSRKIINGQSGWRLPTNDELLSLYQSGLLKSTPGGWVLNATWSLTPYDESGFAHYAVSLNSGESGASVNLSNFYVTCVRPTSIPNVVPGANSPGMWNWEGGSNTLNAAGHYGDLGITSSNSVPSARIGSATWTDTHGKFWLFGGGAVTADNGPSNLLNDLWQYDPISRAWTWMSGSKSPNQPGSITTPATPGARFGALTWVDKTGQLWLFGGDGYDTKGRRSELNDVWRYDLVKNTWTCISDIQYQGNVPTGRDSGTTWVDPNGKFWFFGGLNSSTDSRVSTKYFGDLWTYDPDTRRWTEKTSPMAFNKPGVYGSLGKSGTKLIPGGRFGSVGWVDSKGVFWLFGGFGYASGNSFGALNDLWRYEPAAGLWAWKSGANVANQAGNYGKGIAGSNGVPGAREGATAWTDMNGSLWLFGGMFTDISGGPRAATQRFNDIWRFDPASNIWTWVAGATSGNQNGRYGALGAAAPGNTPGGRQRAMSWADNSGLLWLFGGTGYGSVPYAVGFLNDLWTYDTYSVPGASTRVTIDRQPAAKIQSSHYSVVSK